MSQREPSPRQRGGRPPEAAVPERLLRVSMHVQSRLDEDLSLERVAESVGLAPTYFHRWFRGATGVTLKRYTQRLRLERAAHLLTVFDDTVLSIALDCGYAGPETFTRAFRRHFGTTPTEYRRRTRTRGPEVLARGRSILEDPSRGFRLGPARVRQLVSTWVAFTRHVGPYESVPAELYDPLHAWARRRGLERPLLLGIGQDNPHITPPGDQRFDAAIAIPEGAVPVRDRAAEAPAERDSGPSSGKGRAIGFQRLRGGHHVVVQHVGPMATLPSAYEALAAVLVELRGWQIEGLPTIEMYGAVELLSELDLTVTDICLPVVRKPGSRPRPG